MERFVTAYIAMSLYKHAALRRHPLISLASARQLSRCGSVTHGSANYRASFAPQGEAFGWYNPRRERFVTVPDTTPHHRLWRSLSSRRSLWTVQTKSLPPTWGRWVEKQLG